MDNVIREVAGFFYTEYLKGKRLNSNLVLVGDPGIGKTTIVNNIAVALNYKYIKISLNGISNIKELRGTPSTYTGSEPGRIMKGMQTISVFTRQNKNADEILLMVFTFIGALYLKVKDFHYIEVTDNNILIGTSTIGLMSRHTWSIIIYILLALSIVLLSILSYITFRKNEKYIRAQIVFTAGIGFILMVLYDIFINTRGYIFDYTTDNVMIRNGVISCMLARGMMMLFAFIVLRIQYNSEPELSEIVIYDEIDLATQIYDEKAELLKKEYTNRIRLYRKSVENILKEKEKTEEEKE